MAKPGKGKQAGTKEPAKSEKIIAQNRRARHEYLVLDTLECGIVLTGSEVKSLRNGNVSMEEAYGRVQGDEVTVLEQEPAPGAGDASAQLRLRIACGNRLDQLDLFKGRAQGATLSHGRYRYVH